MKKKTSPKVKKTVVPKVEKKFVETVFGNVPIAKKVKIDEKKSEESSIIQSLLGDIAFAVNGTDHSSIITALTKCHKDILNIKKDVGIAD
tara:strand:+ start:199 stop:468 length:270 start_codon:yes stop_codon:yes gene_type:complete